MNPYTNATFTSFFTTLFSRILALFSGDFDQLAPDEIQLLVLLTCGLSCCLVGIWLSLKKMTMLANALSHTILLGIVLAFLAYRSLNEGFTMGSFSIPTHYLISGAVATGLLTNFLVQFLTQRGNVYNDASIALVFTTLFALGILVVNLATRNGHVGVEAVMGNPDGLTVHDLKLTFPLFIVTSISLMLLHRNLLISSFDPIFALASGLHVKWIDYGLMTLVSFALISSFRAIGVIMVLAFITAPPLMIRPFAHSLKRFILLSCSVVLAVTMIGVALSRHLFTVYGFALSTGGLIVLLLAFGTLSTLTLFQRRKI